MPEPYVEHNSQRKKPLISQGLDDGPPETRTPDPLIKSQLLYQLS